MLNIRKTFRRFFTNLSVGQKVMTVIFLEILSYSVITTIALYQIHTVGNEVRQMANVYLPLFSATESIRQQVQNERLNLKEVIFVGDRVVYDKDSEEDFYTARSGYLEASSLINEKIAFSTDLIKNSASSFAHTDSVIKEFEPRLLKQLTKIHTANRLNNRRVEKLFQHIEDGSFLMGMELLSTISESEKTLTIELDNLISELLNLKSASVNYAVKVERTSSSMTIFVSLFTVCVVIMIFFLVVKRNISNPLHALTDAISSFDALKPPNNTHNGRELMRRGDELGMVARSLNELKRDLRAQGKALHSAKVSAEKADKAKSQFLAAASHDLRQPLHAMQMYLATLKQGLYKKENLEIVSKIESVSITTGRMLNSLLDISQLDAGAVKPQIETFPVQEMFRRLSLSFMPIAQKKGLNLRVVFSHAVICSDPTLLERVVGNFVSNAIQYTEKGSILIGCRNLDENIAIQVWDTGKGVHKSKSNIIFEDFTQLDNDERDKSKGLGLGLAIARRLSDCMGHKIQHSSIQSKGSYFGVIVPKSKSVVNDLRNEELLDVPHDLSQAIVLLIEDDKPVLDATTHLLKSWNCSVISATSPKKALEILATSSIVPNIIIADYRLPGELDGVEVITHIELLLGKAVPSIIITGESELSEIREVSDMGYLVLRKPVRPGKLRSLINHFVSQNQL